MLFTKKIRFSVSESQIKEELLSADGIPLLRLNLRYPELKCPKGDPLLSKAAPFYKQLAECFAEYARTELKSIAQRAKNGSPDSFLPYSAVMRWEKTLENEKYLSVLIDISVSNGTDTPVTERKTQVWDRERGTKCRYTQFFEKKKFEAEAERLLGKEGLKKLERDLFVLRENRSEFFLRDKNSYSAVIFPL